MTQYPIPAPGDPLNPGLLRILRQTAWLRAALIALALALYAALWRTQSALPLLLAFAVERGLFVALVSWNALRRKMEARFLPVALGWLLVTPVVEVIASGSDESLSALGKQTDVLGIASPLIWLVVPVVLAAWQYGRRGLQITLGILVVEHVALGSMVGLNVEALAGFALNAGGRIATLTILGYVVTRLVEAQRAEHAALEQANRRLAQRAATAAQLAESRERNRLARELHDTLAHSLTGLSIQLQALGALLEHDSAAAKTQLRKAQATARSGANEVRRAIQALRATPLQDLGLSEALRQLCRAQAERTGAAFTCDIADLTALDPLTEQAVYRIASAALANVEQHAAATQVSVSLRISEARERSVIARSGLRDEAIPNSQVEIASQKALAMTHADVPRELRLTIQDNGIGFDTRAVPPDRFGLAGMAERAATVGGKLDVSSVVGGGTTVTSVIPV